MSVDVNNVLQTLKIDPREGITRAIDAVAIKIEDAENPMSMANDVIEKFGLQPQAEFPVARIMAKALVQLAVDGRRYDRREWEIFAKAKVEKLRKEQSWLFSTSVVEASEPKTRGRKSSGDKKERALQICAENKEKSAAELATMISKELDITYGNAYYYASRVFKR